MRGVRIDTIENDSGIIKIQYSYLEAGQVHGGRGIEVSVDEFNEMNLDSILDSPEMVMMLLKSAKKRGAQLSQLAGKKLQYDYSDTNIVKVV